MKFMMKSTIPAALIFLAFSGAAYAQHQIGGVEVPADQVERVQAFCDALVADGGPGGPGGGETNAAVAAETPAEDTTIKPTTADQTAQGGVRWDEQEDLGEVIDMQACVDGGFVDQSAAPAK